MNASIQPTPQPTPSEQPAEVQVPPNTVTIEPSAMLTPDAMPSPQPVTPDATVPGAAPATALDNPAVTAARQALASRLQVEAEVIRVIAVEEVEWPDGCLGVRLPGVMCIQVIVPGYRITLEAGDRRYVYHTDQTGQQVILAQPR